MYRSAGAVFGMIGEKLMREMSFKLESERYKKCTRVKLAAFDNPDRFASSVMRTTLRYNIRTRKRPHG
ncbi:hypothetical protein FACS1894219_04000 [Clostridia bacterium]|nr:hypothetical protein FACS1894219_04000 [Clostridia bacterium]